MKNEIIKQAHHPKTVICEDFEAMSRYTADLICDEINKKPDLLLCLPAGNTAIRTFQILKEYSDMKKVDLSKAYLVQLDEWLDLEDESENCTAFISRYFLEPLNIDKSRIRLFNIHADDLESECKDIERFIADHGGIDVMVLGVGMNGHLGLNEPGVSFDSRAHVVTLDPVTQKVGQKYFSKPTMLTRGITLGIRDILESKLVILQASGVPKADIIKKVLTEKPTEAVPASIMQLVENGMVVMDKEAASQLE